MIMNSTKSKALISPSVRRPDTRMIAQSAKKTTVALMMLSIDASRINENPERGGRAGIGGAR